MRKRDMLQCYTKCNKSGNFNNKTIFNETKQFERLCSKQKHCQKTKKIKEKTQKPQNQEKK